MRNLEQRIKRIEEASGFSEVFFRLRNGSRAGIRRKELLHAVSEAVSGIHSKRAMVLLNADNSIGGLPNLVQAIVMGPVPPGEVNE